MRRFQAVSLMLTLTAATAAYAESALNVYSVNYPLQYFAQRIGGEHVNAVFPAPADVDPAYWVPDADVIGAYQQADLILLNGAGYASWMDKVSLPKRGQVNTSASFRDAYIPMADKVTHSHGPGGEHEHTGFAFTTWLDFVQAGQQAEAVCVAIKKSDPDRAADYEAGCQSVALDLAALDSAMMAVSRTYQGAPLMGSHPVYQYLARRYTLNLRSVHWEPHDTPTVEQWSEFRHTLSEHPARWMLWEAEPLAETAEQLEALGVRVVVFDPCGNRPDEGDWLSVMRSNIQALTDARSAH